jgi:hypothetical protein
MASDAALEQRGIFERAGADFRIAEDGVHGASMLSDARTGHDMTAVRAAVVQWLDDHRMR